MIGSQCVEAAQSALLRQFSQKPLTQPTLVHMVDEVQAGGWTQRLPWQTSLVVALSPARWQSASEVQPLQWPGFPRMHLGRLVPWQSTLPLQPGVHFPASQMNALTHCSSLLQPASGWGAPHWPARQARALGQSERCRHPEVPPLEELVPDDAAVVDDEDPDPEPLELELATPPASRPASDLPASGWLGGFTGVELEQAQKAPISPQRIAPLTR
jgi:hypothetical protein